jgi:uncharacterized protein involved in outer membrane biogenesis
MRRTWPAWFGGVLLVLAAGIATGESMGWPLLAGPLQRSLSNALARSVSFSGDDGTAAAGVRIGLVGSVRVRAGSFTLGAPAWSAQPYMLRASDAEVTLGYGDLWRAYRGGALHIRQLSAASLDAHLERRTDGRSSWQIGAVTTDPKAAPPILPTFGVLQVGDGSFHYDDAVLQARVAAHFSLHDGGDVSAAVPAASGAAGTAAAPASPAASAPGLQLTATGSFGKFPLHIEVQSGKVLPLLAEGAAAIALPLRIDARIGRAVFSFAGTATDALHLSQLRGRFSLSGPSLAAVGDPLGVTLPTTAPFRTRGLIVKDGQVWKAVIDQATVGDSRLSGAFTYDAVHQPRPMLAGQLRGSKLLLADLGPAVGTAVPASEAAGAEQTVANTAPGRVLPDRPFDLPALRTMDANVLVDIDQLDLGSSIVQPLKPLRTLIVLDNGVLTLRDIDARTADGRLGGTLSLDGRQSLALWSAQLHWDGVRLDSWIKQSRADGAPPYVSGRLNGQATLAGQGRSTAAILGSLQGGVRMYLIDGRISHLAIEAAGLDVAQALGVIIKGDDALPIDCTVADLVADHGVLRPRVLVLDTTDSTLWFDGSLSLATEGLDLRLIVEPKDFSPFALRSPILLRGSFAHPSISVEKGPLAARIGGAAALALVNPLAALLPFMDIGSSDAAKQGAAKCQALAARKAGKAPVTPEAAAKVTERIVQRR